MPFVMSDHCGLVRLGLDCSVDGTTGHDRLALDPSSWMDSCAGWEADQEVVPGGVGARFADPLLATIRPTSPEV